MYSKYDQVAQRALSIDDLRSGLMARLQQAQKDAKELVEEHRASVAGSLLAAGIQLIPSEHLKDHQYVVSVGVYEAAKKLAKKL